MDESWGEGGVRVGGAGIRSKEKGGMWRDGEGE
jgi:hypothetical protein